MSNSIVSGDDLAAQLGPFAPEVCTAGERLYDYTMRPYSAAAPPGGKLRATTLLYQLLSSSGQSEKYKQLISSLRSKLGTNRTVWGVKLIDGKLAVELYFYFRALSSARAHREPAPSFPEPITFEQVELALEPVLRVVAKFPKHTPAIMASVDVTDEVLESGEISLLHVYLQSGLSWDVTAGSIEHANHYTFFELEELDRLRALIEHQANGLIHASACGEDIAQIFLPKLYSCRTLCLAAKRTADGIYFAGISTDQLRWFLQRFNWPAATQKFVNEHAAEFAHVRWDVGLDFTAPGGRVCWGKSGLYATL